MRTSTRWRAIDRYVRIASPRAAGGINSGGQRRKTCSGLIENDVPLPTPASIPPSAGVALRLQLLSLYRLLSSA